jgi:hypothetical protein
LRLRPFLQPAFFGETRRQNQRFTRPGQRDVKQPQFLTARFASLPPLREPVRQARITPSARRRFYFRTKTELFLKNDFTVQILLVEFLGMVQQPDYRKFQLFALMNAHLPTGILRRDGGNFRFGFRLLLRCDEFQKNETTFAAGTGQPIVQDSETARGSPSAAPRTAIACCSNA